MTFEDTLDQAIDLLRRRGRITYRALQRQFSLDDDYLEDLKLELIEGQRVARDEGGMVLVWVGPATAPPPRAAPSETAAPLARDRGGHAERRQLTVLFSDLVGSTELSTRLDPEDLRDLLRAYQAACGEVVERFGGRVIQYLGDGILVYFGYPLAHEDDARRAVQAGLEFLNALGRLNEDLGSAGMRCRARVGIHTGLVVVGEMGDESRSEVLALGEAPNVAARIQQLTEPDTLVISGATHGIVERFFDVESMGLQKVRGIPHPVTVYRVRGERQGRTRLDRVAEARLTPFVGRDTELALVLERWDQARQGRGQVVVIGGEAGIGKSRFVRLALDRIAADGTPHRLISSSAFFHNSALRPVIAELDRNLDASSDEGRSRQEAVRRFAEERWPDDPHAASLLASLLSLDNGGGPLPISPERRKELTFALLESWLLGDGVTPSVSVWEDLQWADPSTLDLLERMVVAVSGHPVLLIATHRPEFVPRLDGARQAARLVIDRLTGEQVEAMVTRLAGQGTPPTVVQQIVERTDGNPLFVEEVTKLLLESGSLDGDATRDRIEIPATLQDSLMARLDRTGDAKEVAQWGATIGREFSHRLLEAVTPLPSESLCEKLDRLVRAGLIVRRGSPPAAGYTFKHALVQEAAYRSLLKRHRQRFHARIADELAERFQDLVNPRPELLAHHLSAAGRTAESVPYWHRAGELAVSRSALAEARAYLDRGLEQLARLPEGPERRHQEILLQIALGVPLTALKGYSSPEAERAYRRARELCQQAGDREQLVPALYGLWRFYLLRAEYEPAGELSAQLLELASAGGDPEHLAAAHRAVGSTCFYQGRLADTLHHGEAVLAYEVPEDARADALLYDVVDAWVTVRSYLAWTHELLGHSERAARMSEEAIRLATSLGHPFSVCLAHCFASWLHQFRDAPESVRHHAAEGSRVAQENGFTFWVGWAGVLLGWAEGKLGEARAVERMEDGLLAWHATGSRLGRSYFLWLKAEVQAANGAVVAARESLGQAHAFVRETGERYWLSELYRLEGELLWDSGDSADREEAGSRLVAAIEAAADIGAKTLELRAAASAARRFDESKSPLASMARDRLASLVDGFRKDPDRPDLVTARRLLAQPAATCPPDTS